MNMVKGLFETLPEKISQHAQRSPDSIAFRDAQKSVTWSEFSLLVNRMANQFVDQGIGKGKRVALLARNSIAYSEVMAAVLSTGACFIPIPTMINRNSLKQILDDANPDIICLDKEFVSLLPEAHNYFLLGLDIHRQDIPHIHAWSQQAAISFSPVQISPADTFCVLYSSGTTGNPKGIVLSHATRMEQTKTLALLDFTAQTVNIIATPLYSLGALSTWMPTVYSGGCNAIMEKFDTIEYLQQVQNLKVSHSILVPEQFRRLLEHPQFDNFDLSSLKYKFGGSAPCSVNLKQQIAKRLPGEMLEFFSLTEGGVTTALFVNHCPDKLASVGQAANGCILKIINEAGIALKQGDIGEIVGRSALHMDGYLNNATANKNLYWFDDQGLRYIRSGDMGYLDEDGFLFLKDRKKDMIISGGMNIYASDIEAIIAQHPAVAEVAIVAISNQQWGESPAAVIVKKPLDTTDKAQLMQWINQQLNKHQRIAALEFCHELPRNHLGKILKKQLTTSYFNRGFINE